MIDATDALLAAQYEAYPYPARDPADEAKRLIVGSPSQLVEIDHWVFGAARPRSQPLNVLFAGGGTGDGTIMLAQQMADAGRPGRITYLDRSVSASAIARARAQVRGLDVEWLEGSLLELPDSGLGPFDYIDCCGVLHHLPEPAAGLEALLSVLAPGGGLGLMVYAPYGRTGVYELQEALRMLTTEGDKPAARLDVGRRVMRQLPASAWLRHNTLFADHITGGDAGLYDLLLNPRDRAFTVRELDDLLFDVGLAITCWVEPMRYNPSVYLPDAKLRARIGPLSPIEQAALAESVCGNMSTHVVYAVRGAERPSAADGLAAAAVPTIRELSGPDLAGRIRPDGTLTVLFDGLRVPLPLPPLAPAILREVDGRRSVGEIAGSMAERVKPDAFARAWRETWTPLEALNRLLLVPPP